MLTYGLSCDICGDSHWQEYETKNELREKTKEDGWLRKRKHKETKYSDVCPTCAITFDSDYAYEEDDKIHFPLVLKSV